MTNNTARIAFAAAIVLGTASIALAGEGSPDLSNSPDYGTVYAAPPVTHSVTSPAARRAERENYGFAGRRAPTDFSARERALFDRETGNFDND